MSKKESTLLTMVLSLLFITAAAAAALSSVFMLTKPSIDKVQENKKVAARSAVLPGFKGTTVLQSVLLPDDADSVYIYMAYNPDNTLYGAAVSTYTHKAFSGTFSLMVGFDSLGNILGTEVIQASETPGLGDKINKNKSDFALQFVNMNPSQTDFCLKVKKDGGDVDAITAATISSRAYCDAINRAARAYATLREKGAQNE